MKTTRLFQSPNEATGSRNIVKIKEAWPLLIGFNPLTRQQGRATEDSSATLFVIFKFQSPNEATGSRNDNTLFVRSTGSHCVSIP